MRRRRFAIAFAVAALLLIVLLAVVPGIVARIGAERVSRSIGTEVHVGWLTWNPFVGRFTVRGVRVAADRGPAAFAARRITARLRVRDLLRGDYRVERVRIDGARARLRATPEGWALPLPPTAAGGDAATSYPAVALDVVEAPRAHIRLEPGRARSSHLRLRQLHLSAAVDADETRLTVWSWGRLDRASVSLVGRIRAAAGSQRVRLRLAADHVDLARTLLLSGATPGRQVRGRADVQVKYEESGPAGAHERVVSGVLAAHDVEVREGQAQGLRLRQATVSRFRADLVRRRLALGELRLHGPEVWVRRSGSQVSVAGVFGDGGPTASMGDVPPWSVEVARTDVAGGAVHHVDAANGQTTLDLTVEEAHAGRVDASNAPIPFSVVATLGSGGRLAARGDAIREPLGARGHADLTGVILPPLAALAGAPVGLESGAATGSLDLAFARGVAEGSGTVTVTDVKTISPDPGRPEDVMAFKELRLVVRRMRSDPPAAILDALEIDWPYVLVDRTPAGIFPLSLAARPADGVASAGPAPTFRIGRLHVLGGRIDFRDATLEPPYWRALASLDLEARRVEGPALRIGTFRAKGLVDEISPVRVEGTVGDRTRLVAEIDRLDLLPFNAYLQGASPYTVASGAVSARSEITLDRSQLEVNNNVVLSRFGLAGTGNEDFVKREVGVPLTLALALMKDYRGNIALALPFGGDLKEPTFEMRSVILQAIVRAIRGAVLSPLNALGRVLVRDGRIEGIDLAAVPFAPGARDLDAAGRERLQQVGRVLESHPDLAVRFRGVAAAADVERIQDEAALSALADTPGGEPLRAFLRARLAGRPPPDLDQAQRARLDTMLAEPPWPGDELRALALDRGSVAAASLILDHKMDPERVRAEMPGVPGRDQLAPAPGASVELHER